MVLVFQRFKPASTNLSMISRSWSEISLGRVIFSRHPEVRA